MIDQKYWNPLQKNLWFSTLPHFFQNFILEKAQLLHVQKDQKIFHSGEKFNGIYAVLEGSVRLGYIDIHGNEAVAAYVDPIMWFGEISLVDEQPRSHDAIAAQQSTILFLQDSDVESILLEHPKLWFHIAQLTCQKLRYAFLELISIQTQNIYQRLAQRLLAILTGYGNHIEIENRTIHLTQEQLAQMLVCSRQSINQELQNLEKNGVIQLAFKKIEVLDIQALHQIAYSHKN